MRAHDVTSSIIPRALRIAVLTLGVTALASPSVLSVSTDAYADGPQSDGRNGRPGSSQRADADLGIFAILFPGTGAYASGGAGPGSRPASPDADDGNRSISAMFEALSRPQQTRVIQRCKEVLATPTQATADQLELCRTIDLVAGH